MAIDKKGNLTLNKAADAAVPFRVKDGDDFLDLSSTAIYLVVDNSFNVRASIDPDDSTLATFIITADQLHSVGSKPTAYNIIWRAGGQTKAFFESNPTITATGFTVGDLPN